MRFNNATDSSSKIRGKLAEEPNVFISLLGILLIVLSLSLLFFCIAATRQGLTNLAGLFLAFSIVLAIPTGYLLVLELRKWGRQRFILKARLFSFTSRGTFFLFLVCLIGFSTVNTGNNLLVMILSMLLASLLVSGVFSTLVLSGIRIHVRLPETVHAGQTAVLLVTVHNRKKRLSSYSLQLRLRPQESVDSKPIELYAQEKHYPMIQPGEKLTLRMESEFKRRGAFKLNGFELTTKFPFGFFVKGRRIEGKGKITVCPAIVDLSAFFSRYSLLQGQEIRNRKGKGLGIYNIRDYQRGDDARHVHWKSSAKLSRLMVKEFLLEESDSLQLVLSTFLPTQDTHSLERFEKALQYVTSLALRYHREDKDFNFYSGEIDLMITVRDNGFDSLMEYLASVQPSKQLRIDESRIRNTSIVFEAGPARSRQGMLRIDYLTL